MKVEMNAGRLPEAKLTDGDAQAIRAAAELRTLYQESLRVDLSNEALARLYGVHVSTIKKVVSGEAR